MYIHLYVVIYCILYIWDWSCGVASVISSFPGHCICWKVYNNIFIFCSFIYCKPNVKVFRIICNTILNKNDAIKWAKFDKAEKYAWKRKKSSKPFRIGRLLVLVFFAFLLLDHHLVLPDSVLVVVGKAKNMTGQFSHFTTNYNVSLCMQKIPKIFRNRIKLTCILCLFSTLSLWLDKYNNFFGPWSI